jgi:hypothetical protein
MRLSSRILLIVLLLPLGFLFNNCSGQKSGALVLQSTDLASEGDPTFLAGKTSYTMNCAVCHGDIANSSKLGRTAADINSAIDNQPQMKFLGALSDTEISQIAYALNLTQNNPIDDKPSTTQYQALAINRQMLVSNLKEIFTVDTGQDTSDAAINTVINNLVDSHPEAFGGNCSRHDNNCVKVCGPREDPTCMGVYDVLVNASPTPYESVISQAYLTQTCEQILNVDKSIQTVISKSGVTQIVAPNFTDVSAVMRFINRDKPVDSTSVNALIDLGNQSRFNGYSILDQWRFVLLPLCLSTAGELL